ncbi:MAG: cbb3-type cytochrome c oxidase subunit I [Myxococcota bacterium]|nr:cbb3-type cytochrome c oxidase subunit I [Myxococcota bacterium]
MQTGPITEDRLRARRFIGLAVGSLLVAGLLSLALVLGRTPGLDRLAGDPLLFKRALVVHVVLALVVWFHAFTAGLHALLPGRRSGFAARHAPFLSAAGLLALLAAPLVPGAQPVLSNYIPVVDHPLFLLGLGLFAAGVLLSLLDSRLLPSLAPAPRPGLLTPSAQIGLRSAGLLLVVALATLLASWVNTPALPDPLLYYELLFWGTGHVLQFASVAAMLAIWLALVEGALERPLLSRSRATFLFALLATPALVGLVLPSGGTGSALYREGFTTLMRWGIFPVVGVVLAVCVRGVWRSPVRKTDPRLLTFFASASLSVLGFLLGAMIRGSNTLVPAHYHASIGAVSAAFMGFTFLLLEPLGLRRLSGRALRLARWQPLLFGAGQAVFALGFGLAGAHGMGRKVYGAEQVRRTFAETLGLGVMAVGGLAAVAGGLLFLGLVVRAWIAADRRSNTLGDTAWIHKASTPSRS